MFLKIIQSIAPYAPLWLINTLLFFHSSKIDRKRLVQGKHWLKCAQMITERTNHPHSKEIFKFLQQSTFPASPLQNGVSTLRCHNRMRLPLVVLLPEDSWLTSDLWKRQFDMSDGCLASYMLIKRSSFEAICLKGHIELSDFSKGLLYLHEGKHAWHGRSRDLTIEQSKEEKLEEELLVMEFECEIFKLYYGEKFLTFIESEVERILKLGSSFGKSGVIKKEWFDDSFDNFTRLFQAPVGIYDKGFLRYGMEFCIIFNQIEKYGQGNLHKMKSDFLAHYRKSKH